MLQPKRVLEIRCRANARDRRRLKILMLRWETSASDAIRRAIAESVARLDKVPVPARRAAFTP